MRTLGLEVTPLDAPAGAEVSGVDASVPQDPAVVEVLKQAVADHGLIVLRDQVLTEDQHVSFGSAFGSTVVPWLHAVELDTLSRIDELADRPGFTGKRKGVVYFVNGPKNRDKPDDGYLQGWHADMTHLQVPLHYALLNAIEVPESGYETWYANQYLAYDGLDAETKALVDELLITHSFQHVFPNLPPVIHPVAPVHPRSKRRSIYGIPGSADLRPLGLSKEDGDALLVELKAHLETDANVYKHVWRKGDLIVWDNRCVLHRRGPQEKGRTRVLRRVMAGDGDPHAVRQHLMGYE